MAGPKSTDAEVLKRVELCFDLMMVSWSAREIWQYSTQQSELKAKGEAFEEKYIWDVNKRQVEEYCAKAYQMMAEQKIPSMKEAWQHSINQWEMMLRKAVANDDIKNARLIKDKIDKLKRTHRFDPEFEAGGETDSAEFILPDGTKIKL